MTNLPVLVPTPYGRGADVTVLLIRWRHYLVFHKLLRAAAVGPTPSRTSTCSGVEHPRPVGLVGRILHHDANWFCRTATHLRSSMFCSSVLLRRPSSKTGRQQHHPPANKNASLIDHGSSTVLFVQSGRVEVLSWRANVETNIPTCCIRLPLPQQRTGSVFVSFIGII